MDLNSTINAPSHGTIPLVRLLLGNIGDSRYGRKDGKTRVSLEDDGMEGSDGPINFII